MSDEIQEPWASAMAAANIGDPRNGRPSMRNLAEAAGVAPETVRRAITGKGTASQATLGAISRALRVDVRLVSQWAGQAREVRRQYQPPDEAHLLDEHERKAVDQVIRLLAKKRKESDLSGRDTAPIGAVAELRPDKNDVDLPHDVLAAHTGNEERPEDRHET